MVNPEIKNREKLNVILNEACKFLRELFTKTWKEKFGSEWHKDDSYRILGHELRNIQPIHSKFIEEGDINKWDVTTLRAVLTAEDLFNLPVDKTTKIIEIDNIRSEIAHHSTSSVAEKQFNDWFGELQRILVFFGVPSDTLEQIKQLEPSAASSSAARSASACGGGDIPTPEFNRKLDDVNRIQRIMMHRNWISQYRQISNSSRYRSTLSINVPLTQELPIAFAGFKPINLRDMVPFDDNVIYEGRKFAVTVIDEVGFTGSSIALIIEDEYKDAERCSIYGSPHMSDEAKARQVFGPGCKMVIVRPYRRIAMDGKPVIRVDDPATIVMRGYVPNMCRYCGKPNADKSCGRCKNALYCNKLCQTLDWKKLKHKLICQ